MFEPHSSGLTHHKAGKISPRTAVYALIGVFIFTTACTALPPTGTPTSVPTPFAAPTQALAPTREQAFPPTAAATLQTPITYLPFISGASGTESSQEIAPQAPSQTPEPTLTATPTQTPTVTPLPVDVGPLATPFVTEDEVHFAVIGDYGNNSDAERQVSDMVKRWQPEFIITTGDNNYPDGSEATIDVNIGHYYYPYISSYKGGYGSGSDINRFFPSLGNHDWKASGAAPYLEYFSLPGNERYYEFVWGPVHFYALDSDVHEPDGVYPDSKQAAWLKEALQRSTSCWNLVYFHHPAYSSGYDGDSPWMQWPFKQWGANAAFSGHDHDYERVNVSDFLYFVIGLGGDGINDFRKITPGSQYRYNKNYGAMLVTATPITIVYEFFDLNGNIIDQYTQSGCK